MADPKIRIKRSAVAGRIPSVDQVPLGELALNTWDGQLFASKNVGLGTTVVAVNPWLVGTGTDSYNAYFTAGNIGIGSTTPTSKLHVVGDTYVSGVVTANAGFNLGISSGGSVITSGPIKTLNFIGLGNTFLVNGTTVDISIQGGGGGGEIGVQANGSVVGYAQTTLNFIGSGVTGVSIGTTTTITIEPGLVGAAKSVTSFTATAGQTTFNVNYSAGQENVFLNGVRLSESQYTATNGSTIVLSEAAANGDSVDVVVYLRGSDPNRNTNVTLLPPFNGTTTAFTMYQGSTSYLFDPIDERQIVVSLGGVIQQPGVAYTVGTGSSIFFSAAPGAGVSCFITALFSNTVGVPTDAVFINKEVFNPTGIQTTFTIASGYTGTNIDIYRNGIRLVNGSDYTATNGTTVDLATPANGSDVVEAVAYRTYIPPYFGNVKIGVGGTDLLVEGNARVTGILTIGQGSIAIDGDNHRIFNTSNQSLLLNHVGGTVAIGTTGVQTAGNKLEVYGGTVIKGPLSGVTDSALLMDTFIGSGRIMAAGINTTTAGMLRFVSMSSNAVIYAEPMIVTQTGVGFGTTNPQSSIHVNGDAIIGSVNNGHLAGFRNKIINGSFDIWQRGTSLTNQFGSNTYLADRFSFESWTSSVARVTYDRAVDAPAVSSTVGVSSYSARITVTTTTPNTNTSDFGLLRQFIEGYNILDLYRRPFTVSFWVKSSLTGTYLLSIYGGAPPAGGTPGYTAAYTINSANTWEYKVIQVPACPAAAFNFFNSRGLDIMWRLWSGTTTFSGSLGSWNSSGSYPLPSHSAINFGGTNGATWQITQVQVEPGTVATPFERRTFDTELNLCRRYYEKSYEVNVTPAQGTGSAGYYNGIALVSTNMRVTLIPYKVTKRSTSPTLTFYNDSVLNATAGRWAYFNSTWVESTSTGADTSNQDGFGVILGASGLTAAGSYLVGGAWASVDEIP